MIPISSDLDEETGSLPDQGYTTYTGLAFVLTQEIGCNWAIPEDKPENLLAKGRQETVQDSSAAQKAAYEQSQEDSEKPNMELSMEAVNQEFSHLLLTLIPGKNEDVIKKIFATLDEKSPELVDITIFAPKSNKAQILLRKRDIKQRLQALARPNQENFRLLISDLAYSASVAMGLKKDTFSVFSTDTGDGVWSEIDREYQLRLKTIKPGVIVMDYYGKPRSFVPSL